MAPLNASRLLRIIPAALFSFSVFYLVAFSFRVPSFTRVLPFHTSQDPSEMGRWEPSIPLPLVPVAIAVLPQSGKILLWSADTPSVFTNATTHTIAAIYDPHTSIITSHNVAATHHNMFCPGLSLDPSGRPVITGGSTPHGTSIYDPSQNTWITGPPLNTGRGYHAQTTLSDGRIFTIGGSWSGGIGRKDAEVLDAAKAAWTRLPRSVVEPMYTHDSLGAFAADNHPWLFAWKNRSAFQAGPSRTMNWYGADGQGRHVAAGPRGSDSRDAMNGNAVLYDAVEGKILTLGGAEGYTGSAATRAAHIVTISAAFERPRVDEVAPMRYARAYANSVVLPTGDVFVTGGASYARQWTDSNATMVPELWSIQAQRFTELARMPVARTYHSVAVLLPDATVLTGGGGLCWDTCRGLEREINHMDVQVYRPPYLFGAKGLAERPRILEISNTQTRPGGKLEVGTSGEVKEFALVRYGSATHAINTDQRRIRLDGLLVDGGMGGDSQVKHRHEIKVPEDAGIAVPGYWMLFAISRDGVPSVAETILIQTIL